MPALIVWVFCLLVLPLAVQAQGAATLVADRITVTADNRLVAEGNLEVLYDGTRMSATRIIYDQTTDQLDIEGPILIRTADETILTADSASLDPRLQSGLLRGARLVLRQQLQLAANRIDRIDGRYSQLTRAAATSCQVCGTEAPLWEIRAARVLHDEVAQQLYFEDATFRVRGVPIFWLPRMRLPDPTLTRATGFLVPDIRTTNRLGFGVKMPYFVRLGDHADLTLTPYVSGRTRTLEGRYRQAFRFGDIAVRAAVTDDDLRGDELRGFLFAEGAFDLGNDFILSFNVETSSDPAYLVDYGYGDQDRLASALGLLRVRENDLLRTGIIRYESLRDDEPQASLPSLVAAFAYERRFFTVVAGGTLTLSTSADTFLRTSDTPGDVGRDMSRVGIGAAWQRDTIVGPGVLVGTTGAVELDYFAVQQDPAFDDAGLRATPAAALSLRWPLSRTTQQGTTHVIEPAIALAWSDTFGSDVPNEDSTLVEFDEANLFALQRFPGEDARETGARASVGLTWTQITPTGVYSSVTLGRITRDTADLRFSETSGLRGSASDWLLAGHVDLPRGFSLNARTLFDDSLSFGKSGARLDWSNARVAVAAAYVWLPADADENRQAAIAEWTLDAAYRIDERWTVRGDARYDIAADQPARAGFGVGWRNECVTVDLSVSRRYTSTDTVEPTTDFGLSVGLSGFSAGRSGGAVQGRCAP
jgi:LPS-assembly protein